MGHYRLMTELSENNKKPLLHEIVTGQLLQTENGVER